jgi:alpha-amylase/alpha-mannosidase (GH57 family)
MTERWVCVHGHFYQPPRENPWLDAIEPQPSAAPYPDWNARITAECYRPNAAARIVDGEGRITRILDNYERLSFNVGPTLMTWLEREAPDVHRALVDADERSRARFGGHGSAMAQAHSHIILPLASRRDKVTQVRWGIRDFEHRYRRLPEGMWLPECAVDTESLEVLAEEGIVFVVLAPNQARRVRPHGGEWQAFQRGDTGRVYRCPLPSGRSIDLYFYDGAVAQAVAFERLLADGGALADRLTAGGGPGAPLSHIATDGETYGHHHRYGDMALAYALTLIEQGHARARGARLTNYGEFRARFPATWEVEIVEDSSWSCAHGVERWREDCGCNSGGRPGWKQGWRRPLRAALDWLRDRCADVLEQGGAGLLRDPWAARDAYIDVVLDRRPETVAAFVAAHRVQSLAPIPDAPRRILELMELARHAMLMYTSCGWFFDDLAGIETVQILQYAARAIELAERVSGQAIEAAFVDRLAQAESNVADEGDGRRIWARRVVPGRVDLTGVVAHHAVSLLVDRAAATPGEDAGAGERVYCYRVEPVDLVIRRTGKARLVAGTVRAQSEVTLEAATLSFAALHLGEHNLIGGVKPYPGEETWLSVVEQLSEAFLGADLLATQRNLDRYFEGATFTLRSLFGAERQRALRRILAETIGSAEGQLALVYDENAPLMRYLVNHGLPVPDVFRIAGEQTLRRRVLENLEAASPNLHSLRGLIAEARQVGADLDTPAVAYVAGATLARLVDRVVANPDVLEALETASRVAEVVTRMKSDVDLWHAQNQVWILLQHQLKVWADAGTPAAGRRTSELVRLAGELKLAVPA